MFTRSTTPLKSFSEPIGNWIGTARRPNFSWTLPSVRSKSERSRSSLLIRMARGSSNSSAKLQTFSVCTSTPATPSTSTSAESAARMAALVSLIKMLKPGVSIRLIFFFDHSANASAVEMVSLRWISSSSKSVMVVPSSTRVNRFVAPAVKRIPAASVVFPEWPWPISATFLTSVPSYIFTLLLLRVGYQEGMLSHGDGYCLGAAYRYAAHRWGRRYSTATVRESVPWLFFHGSSTDPVACNRYDEP